MATRTPAKHKPPLIRPSFRAAITWIAENDDTDWVGSSRGEDEPLSVTAALVADLFGADDDRVANAIRRKLKRA